MSYGHAFDLLPRCVNHADRQGILKTPDGLLCGPCGMADETPLTATEKLLTRYAEPVTAEVALRLLGDLAERACPSTSPASSCTIAVTANGHWLAVQFSRDRAHVPVGDDHGGPGSAWLHVVPGAWMGRGEARRHEDRGPGRAAAGDRGTGPSLSLPLLVDGRLTGTMNLCGPSGHDALDEASQRRAQQLVTRAHAVARCVVRLFESAEAAARLEEALSSRARVDQAVGIVMGQQHCDAETALDLLRAQAHGSDPALRVLARDLVERTEHPADE